MWPTDAETLAARQRELAEAGPEPWSPADRYVVAGCWVCFPRGLTGPGDAGDPTWTAAVAMSGRAVLERQVVAGVAGAPYRPGLMALRVGPLMEQAVRALRSAPDLLLVDATGRDHPRRAGLALHLGAELGVPSVGVTHRPLVATGEWPEDRRGAATPLRIGEEVVACWLRTRPGTRPLAVHPGWRVDLATAVEVVTRTTSRHRTPEPLRQARHAAREARIAAEPGQPGVG